MTSFEFQPTPSHCLQKNYCCRFYCMYSFCTNSILLVHSGSIKGTVAFHLKTFVLITHSTCMYVLLLSLYECFLLFLTLFCFERVRSSPYLDKCRTVSLAAGWQERANFRPMGDYLLSAGTWKLETFLWHFVQLLCKCVHQLWQNMV
jgi:hypothetical protein